MFSCLARAQHGAECHCPALHTHNTAPTALFLLPTPHLVPWIPCLDFLLHELKEQEAFRELLGLDLEVCSQGLETAES